MTPKQIQLQEAIGWVSLARVLTALGVEYSWCMWRICRCHGYGEDPVCNRKLLKDDWSDATLFDQSQETQDILFDIICKDA